MTAEKIDALAVECERNKCERNKMESGLTGVEEKSR